MTHGEKRHFPRRKQTISLSSDDRNLNICIEETIFIFHFVLFAQDKLKGNSFEAVGKK